MIHPSDLKLKPENVQETSSSPLPYVHTPGSASLFDLAPDDRWSARLSVSAWQSMSAAVTVNSMVFEAFPVLITSVCRPAMSKRYENVCLLLSTETVLIRFPSNVMSTSLICDPGV